jgi:Flp pilus assembly protein TadG
MLAKDRRRFAEARKGNVAVFTAIAGIPIAMAVGVAVDLMDSYGQKSRLQAATDAAALAAARTLMKGGTEASAKAAANDFLKANVKGATAKFRVTDIQVDTVKGTVRLETKVTNKVTFGGLLGRRKIDVQASSLAKGAGTSLEIALVLDNSGSMNQGTRIADLRTAGAKFVDVMDADAFVRKKVSISVVPFSSSVNVGSNNASAAWIDKGTSNIHAEWLNRRGDAAAPAPNRQTIQALMKSSWAWKGCVETRERGVRNLDITDVAAESGDAQTLFTPMFAPDEPDSSSNYRNNYLWDHFPDSVDTVKSGTCTKVGGSGSSTQWSCHYRRCVKAAAASTSSCNDSSTKKTFIAGTSAPNNRVYTNGNTQCATSVANSNTERAKQDRTCKYKGGGFPTGVGTGPNYMCDSAPILPLTAIETGKSTLKTKISGLQALGSTNILEGFMWGWRTLSERAPFSEGRADDVSDNRKILVVMTDGQNTMYDTWVGETLNMTQYSTYGMGSTGRLKTPTRHYVGDGDDDDDPKDWEHKEMMAALDARMKLACENAKEEGYTIYTVILTSESDDEDVDWTQPVQLMRECATDPTMAFAPDSSDELVPVFEKIAKSIRRIHLAQ